MERHTKAGMSVEDMDSIGKELANGLILAAGSGKGILSDPRVLGVFRPVAQSYWNRVIRGDPIQNS